MSMYRVKIESYTTGDRHIIEVRAADKWHAVAVAAQYGAVCDVPQLDTTSHDWRVEMSDGYTVEYFGGIE